MPKTLIYSILDQHYYQHFNNIIMNKKLALIGFIIYGVLLILSIIQVIIKAYNKKTPKTNNVEKKNFKSSTAPIANHKAS